MAGFSEAQVREKLGHRLRLDEPRLNKLFSGQRVVIKRDLSAAEAADWVQRFRAIGAVLHAVPAKAPGAPSLPPASPNAPALPPPPAAKAAPAPARRAALPPPPPDTSLMLSLVPDSELPSPPPPPRALAPSRASAPVAAAATSGPEEVTCPNCGERQSKRVICRSCVCDMPRTLAARQAEAEARRQARLEELRARNEQRLAQEQQPDEEAGAEIPPLLSFSVDGRMGRLRFIATTALALVLTLGLLVASFALTLALQSKAVGVVSLLLALGLAVWGTRLQVLRLHDLNRSGWLALLLLVPGLNALLALALWVWPGDHDENDYGPAVNDGSWLWALLGLVVLGAFAILTTPMLLAGVARATA